MIPAKGTRAESVAAGLKLQKMVAPVTPRNIDQTASTDSAGAGFQRLDTSLDPIAAIRDSMSSDETEAKSDGSPGTASPDPNGTKTANAGSSTRRGARKPRTS